jgi:hypothetical protein
VIILEFQIFNCIFSMYLRAIQFFIHPLLNAKAIDFQRRLPKVASILPSLEVLSIIVNICIFAMRKFHKDITRDVMTRKTKTTRREMTTETINR